MEPGKISHTPDVGINRARRKTLELKLLDETLTNRGHENLLCVEVE
jgi:hypothetical protein